MRQQVNIANVRTHFSTAVKQKSRVQNTNYISDKEQQ